MMGVPNITKKIEIREGQIHYFKAMEASLYNYPKIRAQVADVKEYLTVEIHWRSKDLIRYMPSCGRTDRDRQDILAEMEKSRMMSLIRSSAVFEELDRVVQQFLNRQEFPIVRMYYFNEEPPREGEKEWHQRPDYAPKYTMEDVALTLDINRDTAAKRRNEIVWDMAISKWGTEAAAQKYTWSGGKKAKKLN